MKKHHVDVKIHRERIKEEVHLDVVIDCMAWWHYHGQVEGAPLLPMVDGVMESIKDHVMDHKPTRDDIVRVFQAMQRSHFIIIDIRKRVHLTKKSKHSMEHAYESWIKQYVEEHKEIPYGKRPESPDAKEVEGGTPAPGATAGAVQDLSRKPD